MNYRLIAIQIGDLLKYDSTVNDINRAAQSVFSFRYENFPNESITSTRAQLIHDWILSLDKQEMKTTNRVLKTHFFSNPAIALLTVV